MTPLRVVHTIASTRASEGGTSRSVPGLCEALAGLGLDVSLVTRARPEEVADGSVLLPSAIVETTVVPEPTGFRGRLKGEKVFQRAVTRLAKSESPVIIHDHGAWLATNRAASRAAKETGAIFVVSPRGMLTHWSLGHHPVRKRVAWALFQRRLLGRAALIHATSGIEADELGDLAISSPIAIIPNAIDPPPRAVRPFRRIAAERTALFLSRFHPKKGLPNLVRAWAMVRPVGWKLLLVGPSEGGHREQIERLTRDLGVESSICMRNGVDDQVKWELYHSADLFVLPSYSENFGIVVGEALAAGVPVIATKATPWHELEEHDCGWWIDLGVEPLVQALKEATRVSAEHRAEMGRRGRELVMDRYGRDAVATRIRDVYEWLVTGGPSPEWVRIGCD